MLKRQSTPKERIGIDVGSRTRLPLPVLDIGLGSPESPYDKEAQCRCRLVYSVAAVGEVHPRKMKPGGTTWQTGTTIGGTWRNS